MLNRKLCVLSIVYISKNIVCVTRSVHFEVIITIIEWCDTSQTKLNGILYVLSLVLPRNCWTCVHFEANYVIITEWSGTSKYHLSQSQSGGFLQLKLRDFLLKQLPLLQKEIIASTTLIRD